MKKSIGIIGGMGPLATVNLMQKIIKNDNGQNDQEFTHVYVDCNTSIPDRTEAILNNGANPLQQIVISARKLEKMGADILVMPCNTAHYFYDSIQQSVNIPLINMIEETCKELNKQNIKCVGLLATNGTIKSNIYAKTMKKYNIKLVRPNKKEQEVITDIIYKCVKNNNFNYDISLFLKLVEKMLSSGANKLVLGCTELPIIFEHYCLKYNTIDPTLILAKTALNLSLN